MSYWLKKYNPKTNNYMHQGDLGGMCWSIYEDENSKIILEDDSYPQVGKCLRVGSKFGRTMSNQDWWQTSYIEEILEDTKDKENGERHVKFKTKSGSHYHWIYRK